MSNTELMDLIVSTGDDIVNLISIWGVAFYFKEVPHIIYRSNLFGINFSFNITNFTGLAAISISNIIILKTIYRSYRLSKR
jgi:hypothetical protein